MKLTRTLALSLLVSLLFFGSANLVSAEGDWDWYQARTNSTDSLDKSIKAISESEQKGTPSHESFVDNNLLNVQASAFLYTAGPPESALQSLSEEEKRIVYARYGRGGVIGQVNGAIVALYTPPASSTTYLADLFRSAHIVPQAQAQGLGFAALDPILGTWKIFRNVAYLFFVVIFLIIGFMIMFRQKIGGQTVVTAQQAIPGVIVSLIFVTFSYAIAGFMIDLMYLLMYLMIGLFNPPEGTAILDSSIFGAIWDILTGKGAGISIFSSVGDAVGKFVGTFTEEFLGAASGALGWLAGITAALVVAIAILIASFKIFFELLKTYVSVVISIALSPLLLMTGAIPGQNNFFKWLKGLAGNLLAFPVVLMAFIIYHLFTQSVAGADGVQSGGFIPPFLPGRGVSNAIVTLMGIGILLVIPEIIQQVKKAFGAEGGIAETLGGAMLKNARGGWTGEELPGFLKGMGAGKLLGGAALVGGSALTGAAGAGIGGLIESRRGGSFKEGAIKGGLYGLAAPSIIKASPGIIKDTVNIGKEEVSQYLAEETVGAAGRKLQREEGALKQLGETLINKAEDMKSRPTWLRPGHRRRSTSGALNGGRRPGDEEQ